ncbi:threonine synthase [Anaerosphaera aminiphila DSM 21120]|uniref:Threonine synthase n=1 Tax=Anaerosphaera aminiphila DSM 21120 TaxID=1120995 RepID=A0A1M5RMB3_9FIRM|nr:threonine synthase [Anaerosphaera aminiphila]SHH27178.1 threonine synthase [Anaerosphaera aminiphila DSM 21120]
MRYVSTRGNSKLNSTFETLLKGLSDDGGLYIPEKLPEMKFSNEEIEKFEYVDFAKKIIGTIFDDIDREDLYREIESAYATFEKDILPIKKISNKYVMELYHGSTFAFKDFALSLLPRLIKLAIKEKNLEEKIVVLTATSGDTGSAALYGFKDVEDTKIVVFYPTDGISEIQRRQMTTIDGKNTYAIAIEGNFDDAQSALKEIFNDEEFKRELKDKKYILSSANSINIGRLVPQIVYYYYSYYELVKRGEISNGELISVSVPTGNFGNILAAYLAKKMGLPIKDLICASNKNNILTDFINTGVYDTNREFYKTNSPSMDILISSNLERFLYYKLGDSKLLVELMKDLKEKGQYEVKDLEIFNDVYGYSFNDEETIEGIKNSYDKDKYLMDTHTVIAYMAAEEYQKDNNIKVLVASTASPYKFSESIAEALNIQANGELENLKEIEKNTGNKLPARFENILQSEVTQNLVIEKSKMRSSILEVL